MTDRRRRWALGVVCMSGLVVTLDNLILNVALPTLIRELHASTSDLQWIIDSYLLVFAGLMLVGGVLGDRFGRAKMLRIGLMIFGIASGVAAWSSDVTTLVLCRGVMGIGAALILPTSVAIVANVFTDSQERGRALGVWSAASGVGLALGPVLGGLLLSEFWWGSIFLVNVPIVVIAVSIGWWAIPDSRNPDVPKFDVLGVVLSVLGVSGFVWATIQAPAQGWGSPSTLVPFAAAVAVLGGFVAWELRCEHPMLELGFFRNPRFSVGNLTSVTGTFAWGGTLFVVPQLLQSVFGYSPLTVGIGLMPLAVSFIVAGLLSARLAERIGTKYAAALGQGIFAVGVLVLATANEHSTYGPVVATMVGFGTGLGIALAPTAEAVMGAVPPEQAGLASGTMSTTKQAGTALGVAVIGSLLVSGYHSALATGTSGLILSRTELTKIRTSLGGALEVADHLGGAAGRTLRDGARSAFINGMHVGLFATAGILVLGVVLALRYLPARAEAVEEIHELPGLVPFDAIID